MYEWQETEIVGDPLESGVYICVCRGDVDIKFITFHSEEKIWKHQNGVQSKKVTHWVAIPKLPTIVKTNMLLKKAVDVGLSRMEKIELSNLLVST